VLATSLDHAAIVAVTGAVEVRVGDEKLTFIPVGAPVTDSVTGELNPPSTLSLKVTLLVLPCPTETFEALDAMVKVEALRPLQCLTSRKASIDPSPVAKS